MQVATGAVKSRALGELLFSGKILSRPNIPGLVMAQSFRGRYRTGTVAIEG